MNAHFELDNPAWNALTEHHRNFAIDYGELKCYHPDYCPFGGCENALEISTALDQYAKLTKDFFIIGEKPRHSKLLRLKQELVCVQMICTNIIGHSINEEITALQEAHAETLQKLVNLVQPGYFKNKTRLLGDYHGIFMNGSLVAVAGERMKTNKYVEVSAVVTHPEYTGLGYAKQLVTHTANAILKQNRIPFLHVAKTNTAAIRLYKGLGFQMRREVSFW
ncbi:MAG TPA: GNAT family N-acetyltransferase, partial [Flavitalea sp.]|nr:GNAT family N-acetyltransferase [Flavitalea sp.]